ncbi:MAG: methyltransferase domain-containing protein [Bacteroidota bacterium]
METTFSPIYESDSDFDNALAMYDFRVFGDRVKGPQVLEMGCGRGTTTKLLAGRFPSLHVVDASDRCLELAARNSPTTVQFFHSYFESFQPPTQYDSIVLAHVIEHLENPVAILSRARAWLRPGGSFHIVVPNALSLHRRLGVAMGIIPTPEALDKRDLVLGHRRVYNRDKLRKHIAAAGLKAAHEESIFLKILPNAQLETMDRKLTDALFVLGREFPELCANLYCDAAPAPTSTGLQSGREE